MRGGDVRTEGLFSYVSCEARVPLTHPLRPIRAICDEALEVLSREFEGLYAKVGRPSVPPEKLLRALLLQAFYSIRSERQLMEQIGYNLLFRWFVGLSMDAPVWDVTVFTKNRERLLAGEVAVKFLAAVVAQAQSRSLLSEDHFSVDGTLIDAWASMKSFRPKDGGDTPPGPGRNGERDFHGEKRSNITHASTTDPDAKLYRKGNGQPSRMAFMGHVLMENRNGLVVAATLIEASGTAEREAALAMLDATPRGKRRITLGGFGTCRSGHGKGRKLALVPSLFFRHGDESRQPCGGGVALPSSRPLFRVTVTGRRCQRSMPSSPKRCGWPRCPPWCERPPSPATGTLRLARRE